MQPPSPSSLVKDYLQSLQTQFHLGSAPDGTAVLSTPFRYLTGDPLEIAVWEERGQVFLSDRGGLAHACLLSGLDAIESPAYRSGVHEAVATHGADLRGTTIVRPGTDALSGHAIQALIQSVFDAQATAQGLHRRLEPEPETGTHSLVREILDEGDARYRENMCVSGALGRKYGVDFQLAFRTRGLIRAVLVVAHGRTLEFAERWNFRFRDIHAARPRLQRLVVVDGQAPWTRMAQRTLEAECERVFPPRETEALADYLRRAEPAA